MAANKSEPECLGVSHDTCEAAGRVARFMLSKNMEGL